MAKVVKTRTNIFEAIKLTPLPSDWEISYIRVSEVGGYWLLTYKGEKAATLDFISYTENPGIKLKLLRSDKVNEIKTWIEKIEKLTRVNAEIEID